MSGLSPNSRIINNRILSDIRTILPKTPGIQILDNALWMVFHATGNGICIPSSFDVVVYQRKSGRLTLVCNCMTEMNLLLKGRNPWTEASSSTKIRVQVDDTLWGCPVGSMWIGLYVNGNLLTDEIPVSEFKLTKDLMMDNIRMKTSISVLKLLHAIGFDSRIHRVEICSGTVFTLAREVLEKLGYDVVTVKIEGPMQQKLEQFANDYLKKEFGAPDLKVEDYLGTYAFAKDAWDRGLIPKTQFKWDLSNARDVALMKQTAAA